MELSEFESNIDRYRDSLNKEGVWLFLATLGCWSVNNPPIQLFAISITGILFTYRIYSKLSDKRAFPTIIKDLEIIIRTKLEEGDTQKERLHDLQQIRDVKLSTVNHLKSTGIFLLCYLFLIATLWNWAESTGLLNNA